MIKTVVTVTNFVVTKIFNVLSSITRVKKNWGGTVVPDRTMGVREEGFCYYKVHCKPKANFAFNQSKV
jgi:hypothetical protein